MQTGRGGRMHSCGQVLLRLACMMSLWHAPVPWIHTHHGADDALPAHVHLFHPDLEAQSVAAVDLGWHWHPVLPPWAQHQSEGSEHEAPRPLDGVHFDLAVTAAPPALDGNLEQSKPLALMVSHPVSSARPSCHVQRCFFDTLLLSHTAQQVLGVLRC